MEQQKLTIHTPIRIAPNSFGTPVPGAGVVFETSNGEQVFIPGVSIAVPVPGAGMYPAVFATKIAGEVRRMSAEEFCDQLGFSVGRILLRYIARSLGTDLRESAAVEYKVTRLVTPGQSTFIFKIYSSGSPREDEEAKALADKVLGNTAEAQRLVREFCGLDSDAAVVLEIRVEAGE